MDGTNESFIQCFLGAAWSDWEEHRRICCLSQEQFAKHLLSIHQENCQKFIGTIDKTNNIHFNPCEPSPTLEPVPVDSTNKSELNNPESTIDSSAIRVESIVGVDSLGGVDSVGVTAVDSIGVTAADTCLETDRVEATDGGDDHGGDDDDDKEPEATIQDCGELSGPEDESDEPSDPNKGHDPVPSCDPVTCVCACVENVHTTHRATQSNTTTINNTDQAIQVNIAPDPSTLMASPLYHTLGPRLKLPAATMSLTSLDEDDGEVNPHTYSCPVCKESFKAETQLHTHLCSHASLNIDTKPFICILCHKTFDNDQQLIEHRKTKCTPPEPPMQHSIHTAPITSKNTTRSPKSYSCELCNHSVGVLYELKSHHLDAHPGEPFPFECETCGKTFLLKSKLDIHNLKHMTFDLVAPISVLDEEIDEAIDSNNFVVQQQQQQQQQLNVAKSILNTPPAMLTNQEAAAAAAFYASASKRTYFCTICNAVFVLEQKLFAHMCTVHRPCSKCTNLHKCKCVLAPGEKHKLACAVCGQTYINPRALKKHMALHTGEKLPHECNICGKGFLQLGKYREHYRIHTGEKPCICTVCGKCFRKSEHLRRHMMIHTRLNKCSLCEEVFMDSNQLRVHYQVHKKERRHRCVICNLQFLTADHLRRHLTVHQRDKPYTCSLCGKACAHQAALKSHLQTHSTDRNFACNICGASFKRQKYLMIHMKTHTGTTTGNLRDTPFKCTECDKCFSRKDGLTRHMQCHTGIVPHPCNHCGKAYSRRYKLIKHMESAHNVIAPPAPPKPVRVRKPSTKAVKSPIAANLSVPQPGTVGVVNFAKVAASGATTAPPPPAATPVSSISNLSTTSTTTVSGTQVNAAAGSSVDTAASSSYQPPRGGSITASGSGEYTTEAERLVRNMMHNMNNIDPSMYYQQQQQQNQQQSQQQQQQQQQNQQAQQQQQQAQQQQNQQQQAQQQQSNNLMLQQSHQHVVNLNNDTSAAPPAQHPSTTMPHTANSISSVATANQSLCAAATTPYASMLPHGINPSLSNGAPFLPGAHTQLQANTTAITAASSSINPSATDLHHAAAAGFRPGFHAGASGSNPVLPYLHWGTPMPDSANPIHLPITQKLTPSRSMMGMNIYPSHRESI